MIERVGSIFERETPFHAVRHVLVRILTRPMRSTNARILGWKGASLPLGSRILGSRNIRVGPGFDVADKVWFEAVREHGGIEYDPSILIGKNFRASGPVHLSAVERIEIGDDCLFGSNIFIADHGHGNYRGSDMAQSHPLSAPNARALTSHGGVIVGSNCWLGDNVAVLQGVEIGAGSVIGANSVVTKSIPPRSIAVGAPALVIRTYSDELGEWVSTS